MNIKTAVFIPFISVLFYGFINIKVYILLNSIVFIYFLIYVIKLKSGSYFFLPASYKYLFSAIFISIISFILSPVSHIISAEYVNFLSGFILFILILNIDENIDYKYFYPFLFFIALFGVYKSFAQGGDFVSTVKNANTLAFISILITGMLVEQKKYYMALIFGAVLISTKSVAAMLSVMSVSFYYGFKNRKNIDFKNNYIIISVMIILFIFLLINIDIKSIWDRILWWKVCIDMFFERPLFGWGHSAFAHVMSAFMDSGLKSSYAHNYFVETLANGGMFFSVLWFCFIYSLIKSSSGFYKYSMIASLMHCFFDFGIDTSSGGWFFMFFSALSIKKEKLMFRLGDEYKKYRNYAILMSIFLFVTWISFSYRYYVIYKINTNVINMYDKKDYENALIELDHGLSAYPKSIDLAIRRIEVFEKIYEANKDERYLKEVAKSIEYLLLINPYYRTGYDKLEYIYRAIDDEISFNEFRTRKKRYLK